MELQRAITETGPWLYERGGGRVTCQPYVWVELDDGVKQAVMPYWERLIKLDCEYDVDVKRAQYVERLSRQQPSAMSSGVPSSPGDPDLGSTASDRPGHQVSEPLPAPLPSPPQELLAPGHRSAQARDDGEVFVGPAPPRIEAQPPATAGGGGWAGAGSVDFEVVKTAAIWIGGALGTGVVGNAFYDALKTTMRRLLGRKKRPLVLEREAASRIARDALSRRAADAGISDLPDDAVLHVECWRGQDGWLIRLSGDNIKARVRIPSTAVSEEGVKAEVAIVLSGSRMRREQAADAWSADDEDFWGLDEPGSPGGIR
ncbi:hypothetical protein [Micromonospora sp. NPDC050200]|uniref:hypothetical protein n=1 Tax=Micromonospora sp. NPDC050200 TaxID=3155664 RepID=UPI003400297D